MGAGRGGREGSSPTPALGRQTLCQSRPRVPPACPLLWPGPRARRSRAACLGSRNVPSLQLEAGICLWKTHDHTFKISSSGIRLGGIPSGERKAAAVLRCSARPPAPRTRTPATCQGRAEGRWLWCSWAHGQRGPRRGDELSCKAKAASTMSASLQWVPSFLPCSLASAHQSIKTSLLNCCHLPLPRPIRSPLLLALPSKSHGRKTHLPKHQAADHQQRGPAQWPSCSDPPTQPYAPGNRGYGKQGWAQNKPGHPNAAGTGLARLVSAVQ